LDQNFGYDNLNRLIGGALGSSAVQYGYDATGNRTAKAISGTSYPNVISATSNRLDQTQDTTGTATVQHDAAGNITSDGTNTYSYSDRGRLATMTNAGGTVNYSYSALELRMSKTGPLALVPTGAAYYVYDEEGKLLGEYDASGAPVHETIYMGMPVGVIKQTGTAAASDIAISLYNVSTDQLGAPRMITRQSDEAIVWRWDTAEAFGATAPDQNPASLGTFTFNQRLPGQVFDAESGLFQNWNREYNPRVGRYMQSDPIGLAGGINTFAYVAGTPLSGIDPNGLSAMGNVGGFLGGWGGRIGGAAVGELIFPIGGGIPGALIGGKLGSVAGTAAGDALDRWIFPSTQAPALPTPGSVVGDYSPWSPNPAVNDDYVRDRDQVKNLDTPLAPYKNPQKPECDEIRARIKKLDDAIAAREHLTNKWYGGVWNAGHAKRQSILQEQRDRLQRRLDRGECTCP
jgi:RHS repeat-associated protein